MNIIVDMPHSVMHLDGSEDVASLTKFAKALTSKVKVYNNYGPPTTKPVCLLESQGDGTHFKFRTGLLSRVQKMAAKEGLSVHQIDARHAAVQREDILRAKTVPLRDYQTDLTGELLKHDMGTMYAATAAGKTHMAAAMIAQRGVTTLFIIHTRELLKQTHSMFSELLGIPVGILGNSERDIQPVTVSTVQTLYNLIKSNEFDIPFDMLIQDEVHHVPANTFYTVTGAMRNCYVYGLSATPYRLDGADLMIEAACGPIVTQITPTELIEKQVLSVPDCRFISVPGETSYSHAPRHVLVNKYIVRYEPRNNIIAHLSKQHAGQGDSVLISVNWVKHAELLHSMIPGSEILHGKCDGPTRERLLKGLQTKQVKILISTLMREGVDVPSLDVAINGAGGTDTIQFVGRVLRRTSEKSTAIVYDFIDNQHKQLYNNSMARYKRCKKVKAFKVNIVGETEDE